MDAKHSNQQDRVGRRVDNVAVPAAISVSAQGQHVGSGWKQLPAGVRTFVPSTSATPIWC